MNLCRLRRMSPSSTGNNRVEADHGWLKARLRPMRGLKRLRLATVIAAGHAFIQNLRRGHYELAIGT
jgi:IS6 family transposase